MSDLRWLTDYAAWPAKTRLWAPAAGVAALILFWLVFDWWFVLSLILALGVLALVVWFTRDQVVTGVARPPVMPASVPATPEPVAPVEPAPAEPAPVEPEPVEPEPAAPVTKPELSAEAAAEAAASERVRAAARAAGDAARLMAEPPAVSRPAGLDAPRAGEADDLKRIRGVGPKLEAMLHGLGYYHFDQIAGWTAEEVAWVDSNLEGFSGRVTRDDWVTQARILAAGGTTDGSGRDDE